MPEATEVPYSVLQRRVIPAKSLASTTKSIMPWLRTRLNEASSAGVISAELGVEIDADLVAGSLTKAAMQPAQVTRVVPTTASNTQPIPRKTLAAVFNEAILSILD